MRLTTTTIAASLFALPALAQVSEGQRSSLPPEVEGPEFSETQQMPAGNHTFASDMPVASRIVQNGELSQTYLVEGGTLELAPPAIAMDGWEAVAIGDLTADDLEGVEVYPQAWQNLGVMAEIEDVEADGIVVALPEFAGLLDHEVLVPAGAFTILTPSDTPGQEFRAFLGTTEALLRDLEEYED